MSRVLTLTELAHAANDWRRDGAVIVLAAGCFDPLHLGHTQHLEAARALGNVLVVAVATDRLVKLKETPDGPRRPFLPVAMRTGIVCSLRCVDAAVVNDAACEVIETLRPAIYVKGSEYMGRLTPDLQREAALLERIGGRLEFLSGPVVCSSTALLAGV